MQDIRPGTLDASILTELLDVSPDALFTLSRDGIILSWNHGAEALFGYSAGEAIGRPAHDLIAPEGSRDEAQSQFAEAGRDGILAWETVRRRKDGSLVHVQSFFRRLGAPYPEPFLAVCEKDATLLKRFQDEGLVQAKASDFLEAAPDAMVIVGKDGRIQLVNGQTEKLFGYPRAELIGQLIEILVPPRYRAGHPGHRSGYFADPKPRPMGAGLDLYAIRKDGTEFPAEISLAPVQTAEGTLVTAAIRDVTDRRRAENALRASEARIRMVLETADEAYIEMDEEGRIREWNPKAEAIFGWSRSEALASTVVDTIIPPDLRDSYRVGMNRFLATGEGPALGKRLEMSALHRDGRTFPVELNISPIQEGAGYRFSAFIQDITERKKSEERFRGLLESAPDAMVIVNREGTMVLVNSQTEKLFNYSREDLIGKPVEILVPNRFREGHPGHRRHYFEDPKARAMGSGLELYGRRRDGSEFPVEISLSPMQTRDETLVSSAIRDVTDRKKAEELKFQLASIVDSSDDAIIGKTLEGIIISWNKGAERIFGYNAAETRGKPISMLLPPGRVGEEPKILERLMAGERAETFEAVRRRKDGQDIDVSVTISPILDSRGQVVGASKVARDISDRKRVEKALAKAKEAAEMASREYEAFSYSVAHDLRAPLRGIDGFSKTLLDDYSGALDQDGQRYLRRVRENAQHMGQLIDSLLRLARVSQSELRREPIDLSALARSVVNRLRSMQPERQVEVLIADGLSADADVRLLEVVLENLLGNAWKFTGKLQQARIEFGRAREDGEDVYFVKDNGVGFDMAYASKLFGVFQRLHAANQFEGTGIGLATVQRIIHRHGGRIWARSEPDHGAVFNFTLEEGSP